MTTIAYDGRYLAADTRQVVLESNNAVDNNDTHKIILPKKIRVLKDHDSKSRVLAITGCGRTTIINFIANMIYETQYSSIARSCFRADMLDMLSPLKDELFDDTYVLVVTDTELLLHKYTISPVKYRYSTFKREAGGITALGEGRDEAIATMELHGINAIGAVYSAFFTCRATGGYITYLDTKHPEKGVQAFRISETEHARITALKGTLAFNAAVHELTKEPEKQHIIVPKPSA